MTGTPAGRRIAELLEEGERRLAAAGVAAPRTDAELLLGYTLNTSRSVLYAHPGREAEPEQRRRFSSLVARRERREPVAYIVGEREFWSLPFHVSPAVLIPRPETEFLVEAALAGSRAQSGKCLDLFCGSGIIGIVLSLELQRPVVGVDISMPALEVAARNRDRHGVKHLFALVQADLATCFAEDGPFSLVVANPPYVEAGQLDCGLDPEVSRFEPRIALDGGPSGLDQITRIRGVAPRLLEPGGDLFVEIGAGQGAAAAGLFSAGPARARFSAVTVLRDYAGRDRVLHVRMSS